MNKQVAKVEKQVDQYTSQEIELIRNTFAKDLAPQEFEMFKAVSRATGLNIIMRQLYAVKRKAQDGESRVTFQTSIDGFRLTAQRSKEYAGQQGPFWCGEDGDWKDVWLGDKPPAASKVGVLRQGFAEPVWGVAKFNEYAQSFNGQLGNMWRKMPDLMIAKCAEALALRKAFPAELSGLYTSDEMMQADAPAPAPIQASVQNPTQPQTADGPVRFVITEETYSQMVDMMNVMEWTDKKQTLVFQKAELVGPEKAMAGVKAEYDKWKKQQEGAADVKF